MKMIRHKISKRLRCLFFRPSPFRCGLEIDGIRTELVKNGYVLLGPAEYDLGTETLALNGRQSIIGTGAGVRFLYSGSDAAIACNTMGVTTSGRLSGFEIVGSGNGCGIRIGQHGSGAKSAQMCIDNVRVTGFACGIECVAAQICRFINLELDNNEIGIFCKDFQRNTQCLFSGLSIRYNSRVGVLINDLTGSRFDTCAFELNGEEGVYLHTLKTTTRIQNIRFDTCWFEQNNKDRAGSGHAEMKIENDHRYRSEKIMLSSCTFDQPKVGDFQIWIGNAEEVLFDNNKFINGEAIFTPTTGPAPRILTRGRATRNQSISKFGPIIMSSDDTQLDVHLGDVVEVSNSRPTTINRFTTYWTEDGDIVIVRVNDANTIFHNSTDSDDNLRLADSVDYRAKEGDVLTFLRRGNHWIEIGRYNGGVV